jgi:hypothetical protein
MIFPLSVKGDVDPSGKFFSIHSVTARCELARRQRTFRCDRVLEVIDSATGEILDANAWIRTLSFDQEAEKLIAEHMEAYQRLARKAQYEDMLQQSNLRTQQEPIKKRWPGCLGLAIAVALALMVGKCVLSPEPSADPTAELADSAASVGDAGSRPKVVRHRQKKVDPASLADTPNPEPSPEPVNESETDQP